MFDKFICGECGMSINKNDNFCSNCGVQLIEIDNLIVKEDGVYFFESAQNVYKENYSHIFKEE